MQTGHINTIHEINITDIETTIHLLAQVVYNLDNSSFSNIAKHKLKELYSNFNQIKPRKRLVRSIDVIGSVWKWIGGSPYAQDLQIINRTMNDLIESNNLQYQVNEQLGNRIKVLTNEIKQIMKNEKINDFLIQEFDVLTAIINIDTINKVVENVQEAISLSKTSTTNNKLLSPHEIFMIKKILEEQGITIDTPDEAITYVTPKIAVNNETLLYILKVPELQSDESRVIEVFSLNHNNTLIKDYPKFLVQNRQMLFTTTRPEEYVQKYSYTTEFIDDCISPLVAGKASNCVVVPEYSTTTKIISDNLLLIENANGHFIKSDCGPNDRILNGNFLVTFSNCSVQFGKENFTSKEIYVKSFPISGTTYNLDIHSRIIENSLTFLDNRTLTNRKHIEHIYLQQSGNIIWNWSLLGGIGISTTVFITIIILAYFYVSHLISAILNQIGKRKSRTQNNTITEP